MMSQILLRILVLQGIGLIGSGMILAQESVNSSGGDAKGIGGSVAYSIGQLSYTTIGSNTVNIAQGVQHAYEIYSVSTTETERAISVHAFPNPTTDILTLRMDDFKQESFFWELFDLKGKLIKKQWIYDSFSEIEMSDLPAATYFLSVEGDRHQKIKTFKIIKN